MDQAAPIALERLAARAAPAAGTRAAQRQLRELIGEDLWQLTRRLGTPLAAAEPVTTVRCQALSRAAFRLHLDDGSVLKGRRMETTARARVVERLARLANPRHFAGVLARRRAALLEEWRPGDRLDSRHGASRWLEDAGAALGALHVTAAGRATRYRSRRVVLSTLDRLERRLRELEEHAGLSADEALEALRTARAWAPASAATGLVHGDYCGENLVVANGAVVAIDNEGLDVGALDYDLARTWVRWPMTVTQALAFYRGYGRHRSREPFERHLPFWVMVAFVDSACFRARARSPTLPVAIASIRRFADLTRWRGAQCWHLAEWPSARLLQP